jgi:hypothetical protein
VKERETLIQLELFNRKLEDQVIEALKMEQGHKIIVLIEFLIPTQILPAYQTQKASFQVDITPLKRETR